MTDQKETSQPAARQEIDLADAEAVLIQVLEAARQRALVQLGTCEQQLLSASVKIARRHGVPEAELGLWHVDTDKPALWRAS